MRGIKKDKNTKIDFKKIENIFSNQTEIKCAYLFGSYARGEQKIDSDIDIGVLLDENFNKMIKLDLLTSLTENGFDDVDLVILNNASILLQYEIVKHNHPIYIRSDFEPASYFSKIIRLYLDFKPYLEIQRKYLKERILNG